ncbi:MAG: hypothetical protein ABI772_07240 [Bacteroidota bacterium]
MIRKIYILLILTSVSCRICAQTDEAGKIIDKLIKKFQLVNTYSADVVIRPEISFLKMLPQKATIYFRQPDKFRIKTTGITILPKQQFDNVMNLLSKRDSYIPLLTSKETINDIKLSVINVIPVADTSELILAKIWVDEVRNLIVKAQLTTKTNGTILINYKHGALAEYGLPDEIIFTVDMKKFKVPKAVAADINTESKSVEEQVKQQKPGKIIVTIKNYKLNIDLPDNIFKN